MFDVPLRPGQLFLLLLHFAFTCGVCLYFGQSNPFLQALAALGFPYFLWSTVNILRYFHMKNRGVQAFHSLRNLSFVADLQEGDRKTVIVWYWKKGLIQGVELQISAGKKALSISLLPFYNQHVVSHDFTALIHHKVEYFLRDNPRYRIRLVINEKLPMKST